MFLSDSSRAQDAVYGAAPQSPWPREAVCRFGYLAVSQGRPFFWRRVLSCVTSCGLNPTPSTRVGAYPIILLS